MKLQITPIKISLKDLPTEGRDFEYSRESGELDAALKDLVGKNPYTVKMHITPMGNAFDLKGSIQTQMDLQCAHCGGDFKYKVDQKLNEVLVEQVPLAKGDFQTKANHAHEWKEEGPDYIQLESDVFNVADYIHEAVALAEPLQPIGRPDCDPNCENIHNEIKRNWLTFGEEAPGASIKANPFQVLEKIKLKS
jgi:uncharacterized metal-binding protein YceD (DUF177 family)